MYHGVHWCCESAGAERISVEGRFNGGKGIQGATRTSTQTQT